MWPFARLRALALAAGLWLPTLHCWFEAPPRAELAERLSRAALGQRPESIAALRQANAEWDFMGRTYFVLALANIALRDPTRAQTSIRTIDQILTETLELEERHGMRYFLMPYAQAAPFVMQPERSQFLDGEIALMLGARRLVQEEPRWAALHRERVERMIERMERSPTLSAESYPDEAWTFCNTVALAAIAMQDALEGSDHGAFFQRWVGLAKERLVDRRSGLLISSFTLEGKRKDGPEGSSIFMAAHCLELIDPAWASSQYQRAKVELIGVTLGFGWAREWPSGGAGPEDIDSGPTVPLLSANAGASGMAVLGAAAFGDDETLAALLRSLELAAYPLDRAGARRYQASNAVGDAVLLYALVQGPLWRTTQERRARGRV